jgi:tetratricopeptide (TPR) repeat protein
MKYCFIILSLIATSLKSQTILNFNKRFVECEDKWVAFKMDKDSCYSFGFIYIDEQAGLTYNFEGSFKIFENGDFKMVKKIENTNMKIRLNANNVKVAIIPESKFRDLNISATPDWLSNYKTDTNSIKRLYRWGFLYNSWDECTKALTYLEKAQAINPKYKGLEFELAFAYNALEQYEKAIAILNSAIETSPDECLLYKELAFAQMHLGQLEIASKTCNKGISICTEMEIKCEISYNLAYQYYKNKDKKNFKKWAKKAKKYSFKNNPFIPNIDKMEKLLNE